MESRNEGLCLVRRRVKSHANRIMKKVARQTRTTSDVTAMKIPIIPRCQIRNPAQVRRSLWHGSPLTTSRKPAAAMANETQVGMRATRMLCPPTLNQSIVDTSKTKMMLPTTNVVIPRLRTKTFRNVASGVLVVSIHQFDRNARVPSREPSETDQRSWRSSP